MKTHLFVRALAWLAAFLLTANLSFAQGLWSADANITWYTPGASSYTIATPQQLAGLAQLVNNGTETFAGKTITLGGDIGLSARQWVPIGNSSINSFQGNFDGNGKTISGLTIGMGGTATYQHTGLFGYIRANTTDVSIKDLTLEGDSIIGRIGGNQISYTGALAGRLYIADGHTLSITNCHNRTIAIQGGNPTGGANTYAGGLVGSAANYGTMTVGQCQAGGAVTGGAANGSTSYAGGLIGAVDSYISASLTIAECLATGSVASGTSTLSYTGGLTGQITNSGSGTTDITHCYASGKVENTATANSTTGGLIASASNSGSGTFSISECYAAGIVTGYAGSSDSFTGGLVGQASVTTGKLEVSQCVVVSPAVTGGNGLGRVAGYNYNYNASFSDNYAYVPGFASAGTRYENGTDWDGLMDSPPIDNWDTDIWIVDPSNKLMPKLKNIGDQPDVTNTYLDPTNSSTNPFLIKTVADLERMRNNINAGLAAWLTAWYKIDDSVTSLDLSALNWEPIGNSDTNSFQGNFDGNGKTISGLSIGMGGTATYRYTGLFGYVRANTTDVSIKDLTLEGDSIIGWIGGNQMSDTGALAGCMDIANGHTLSITNCHNRSIAIQGGNPRNMANSYTGGLVGYAINYGTMTVARCQAGGAVTGGAAYGDISYAGGLIGVVYSYGSASLAITECLATGSVAGGTNTRSYTGGLTGQISTSGSGTTDITHCYATGKVENMATVYSYTGGLIASASNSGIGTFSISECYAAGIVTGYASTDNSFTGGLVGEAYRNNGPLKVSQCVVVSPAVTVGNGLGRVAGDYYNTSFSDNYAYVPGFASAGTGYENGADWDGLMGSLPIRDWDKAKAIWIVDPSNKLMPKLRNLGDQADVINPVHYYMAFVTNGGSAVDTIHYIYKDSVIPAAPVTTRTGYTFDNWYSDTGFQTVWTFGDDACKVIQDTTLYARWKSNLALTLSDDTATYTGGKLYIAPATLTGATGGATPTVAYKYIKGADTTACATDAGTYKVVAAVAGDDNHVGTTDTAKLVVGQATPVIALTSVSTTHTGSPVSINTPTVTGSATAKDLPLDYAYEGVGSTTYPASPNAPGDEGEYTVTVSTGGNANHTPASATARLVIGKNLPTMTLSDASKTYDGTPFSIEATLIPSTIGVTYTYSGTLFDGTPYGPQGPQGLQAPTDAGTYTVTATSAAAGGYASVSLTATLRITRKQPVITMGGKSAQHTGSAIAIDAPSTDPAGAPLTITYTGIAPTSYAASAAAPSAIGHYEVKAAYAGSNNYEAGTATGLLSITDSDTPALTLASRTVTYNGQAQSIGTATIETAGASGLAVTYTYSNATYPASATAPKNAGIYTVTAATAADATYKESQVEATLTILKAPQVITFALPATKRLGDAPFSAGATVSSDSTLTYRSGNTAIATVSDAGLITLLKLGTVAITASQAGSDNYHAASETRTLTIDQRLLTLTMEAETLTYTGEKLYIAAAKLTGTLNNEPLTIAYSYVKGGGTATDHALGAGTYTVTATTDGDANHAPQSATATLTVDKATPTIKLTATTDGIYTGKEVPVNTPDVSGSATVGKLPLEYSYIGMNDTKYGPTSTPPKEYGDYRATVSTPGDENHTGASGFVDYSIGKGIPQMSLSADSKTYDGAPLVANASVTPNTLPLTCTYSGTLFNGTDYASTTTPPVEAGNYSVTASTPGDANYSLLSLTVSFTISKKKSTIAIDSKGAAYNGSPIAVEVRVTDPAGAPLDAVYYTGIGSTVYGESTTAPTKAGSYSVKAIYEGNNNYLREEATGSLTINEAGAPTLTLASREVTYNGSAHSIGTATVEPTLAAKELTVTYTYSNATYPASENAPVNAGVYTVVASTPANGNFKAGRVETTLTILRAGQTITFALPAAKRVDDDPFTAGATVNTGLPLTYQSGNTDIATVSPAGMIQPVNVGTVTITVAQAGNENYLPASETRTLYVTPVEYVDLLVNLDLTDPDLRAHIGLNPVEGRTQVPKGRMHEQRIWVDSLTHLSDIVVELNGERIHPSATELRQAPSGGTLRAGLQVWELVYVYSMMITDDATINISGIYWNSGENPNGNPTGSLPNPSAGGANVSTIPGYIIVQAQQAQQPPKGEIRVYTMTGQLVYASPWGRSGGASFLSIPAKRGIYIVTIDNLRWKVRVE